MEIVIYTTKDCPFCKRAKEFFKKHNIKYSEKDVGNDEKAAEEMIKLSGHHGVPVINVDGEIIVGFDEEKLKEALKL